MKWCLLPEGGRLAVVSFHSVEDRMVKRFLQIRSGGYTLGAQAGEAAIRRAG